MAIMVSSTVEQRTITSFIVYSLEAVQQVSRLEGNREITYPYYDASIGLTEEEAKDSLKYLENK